MADLPDIILNDKRISKILGSSANEEDIILMFATHRGIREIQDDKGRFVKFAFYWVGERELETSMRTLY